MSKRITAILFILFMPVMVPMGLAAEVAKKDSVAFSIGIESFQWKEFGTDGGQLLKESGPRFTFGARVDNFLQSNVPVIYGIDGKLYLGQVDYDGQTQSGIPASTDTDYFGFNIEAMAGRRYHGTTTVDIVAAVGLDTWVRDLKNGTTITGQPTVGVEEEYFILYGRLGPGFLFRGASVTTYLQFGVKYPFYTDEHVNLSAIGFDNDVDLEPGKDISGYLVLRLQPAHPSGRSQFSFKLYYDSFRFDRSSTEIVTTSNPFACDGASVCGVLQPESEMDVLGAQFEYVF